MWHREHKWDCLVEPVWETWARNLVILVSRNESPKCKCICICLPPLVPMLSFPPNFSLALLAHGENTSATFLCLYQRDFFHGFLGQKGQIKLPFVLPTWPDLSQGPSASLGAWSLAKHRKWNAKNSEEKSTESLSVWFLHMYDFGKCLYVNIRQRKTRVDRERRTCRYPKETWQGISAGLRPGERVSIVKNIPLVSLNQKASSCVPYMCWVLLLSVALGWLFAGNTQRTEHGQLSAHPRPPQSSCRTCVASQDMSSGSRECLTRCPRQTLAGSILGLRGCSVLWNWHSCIMKHVTVLSDMLWAPWTLFSLQRPMPLYLRVLLCSQTNKKSL